jgi:DNA-directed RNA polymerase subunit K/omega
MRRSITRIPRNNPVFENKSLQFQGFNQQNSKLIENGDTKMIYPTVEQLTNGEFNRYELVVGVAKCARIVTDEYIDMRTRMQKLIDNHETEKPLSALIDPEYKDQKAVKIAIAKLESGRFRMKHPEEK